MIAFTLIFLLALLAMPASAPAQDQLEEIVPFEARAADGTVLSGDVYLPDREGPLATVLELSPYWNNAAQGPSESQAESPDVKPFVEAGFAVALVNLRGTGESGGCFQWGSRVDWNDASTVVEALAGAPWSNGSVGMYGTSYVGWTQFMAMGQAPPALKAAVPISGVIDVWSLLVRRGAPISIGPLASSAFGGLTSFTGAEPALPGHAACPELAEHVAQGAELASTGDRTEYYRLRDLRPLIEDSAVPVLLSNGLLYFSEGHTLQFEGLWDLLRPDRTRFVLGQWGHGGQREDFTALSVGWFDHYLRGGPQATQPGIVEYQDDAGAWHATDRWPPPARRAELHLSGEALTARSADVEPSERSFQSADADTAADGADELGEELGAPGNGPVCGPHQVIYASAPLAQDVLLAGNFSVDLTLTSTLSGGNLVATLYHTAGDASCADLLAGASDSSRVQMDLRHWAEEGRSRDFPVGAPTRVTADSMPFATSIPKGHRIVLAIGAGSLEIEPDPLKPQITISTGDGLPGSVSLPVAGGRLDLAP